MFNKFVVCCFFLFTCNAQDYLTCVRNDQTLRPISSNLLRTQQGRPGKRGPVGPKGDQGMKGSKGETGFNANEVIMRLREEINQLRVQIKSNTNNIANNTGPYRRLGNGWVILFNGFQYKFTPEQQSWNESRSICQQWGGDLVVYGVQDIRSRSLLRQAIVTTGRYWIGASDIVSEGNWVWVNGQTASPQTTFYLTAQRRTSKREEDCAVIISSNEARDRSCTRRYNAVCEKFVSV